MLLGKTLIPVLGLSLLAFRGAARGEEAAIVRGPYLQRLLGTHAEIVWHTDLPSDGRVAYAEEGGAERVAGEGEARREHRAVLDGLIPGRRYRYHVLDGERALSEAVSFRTSPPPGDGEIRIAALGDSGTGRKEQLDIAGVIAGMEPDIFLHTGDMDYVNDVDCSIFGPYQSTLARSCFFPVVGNHDVFNWSDVFFLPGVDSERGGAFYSFDWGNAHFVALDTVNRFEEGSEQIRWLEADLEAARGAGTATWTILFFHYPVYSVGSYQDLEDSLGTRRVITPIVDRFGVDLVLSGHDHNYQRTHPIREDEVVDAWQDPDFITPGGATYLITGGGGQVLYPEDTVPDYHRTRLYLYAYHALEIIISQRRLSVRALGPEREVLDAFSIEKGRPAPPFRLIRGDADLDGRVNITDALAILGHLFLGKSLDCRAAADVAADANGSGPPPIITDAIYLLGFLFLGSPPPPSPFPDCGEVPGADGAGCTRTGC